LIIYDPAKHEMLLLKWYLDIMAKPDEFQKLFMKPLRQLTAMLTWAATQVRMGFEMDGDGISMIAWVEPCMSGAFFGAWVREEQRKGIKQFTFIRQAYKWALEFFPVLIGVTKQPELHDLHIALGYQYVGKIEHLFDDDPAMLYMLDREHFYGRRRRKDLNLKQQHIQPVRAIAGVDGAATEPGIADGVAAVGSADHGSAANGGRKRAHPNHKRKPRLGAHRSVEQHERDQGSSGPIGPVE